ncbi:hypothetical protein [Microbacterium sp. NPDC055683]
MSAPAPVEPGHTTWSTVDSGFHVAGRKGEFVGFIDTSSDGRHLAFDRWSTHVGDFDDITEAKAAVEAVGSGETGLRPARRSPRALIAAGAATGMALLAAATSLAFAADA